MKIDWPDLIVAVLSAITLLAGCLAIHYSLAMIVGGAIGLAWVAAARANAMKNDDSTEVADEHP